jgi:hypothetical protein
MAGDGLVAVGVAACAPAAASGWTFGPSLNSGQPAPSADPASPSRSMDHTPAPSASAAVVDHDANAKAVVERFLGGGEAATLPLGNQPLEPSLDGDPKVFELTIDRIHHRIDATNDPIDALGYNGTWPGPRLTVVEGERAVPSSRTISTR